MVRLQHNSTKAYVILDLAQGTAEDALSALSAKEGIQSVDLVTNPLRLVVVVRGNDRDSLQKGALDVISSIGDWATGVQCLPVVSLN